MTGMSADGALRHLKKRDNIYCKLTKEMMCTRQDITMRCNVEQFVNTLPEEQRKTRFKEAKVLAKFDSIKNYLEQEIDVTSNS